MTEIKEDKALDTQCQKDRPQFEHGYIDFEPGYDEVCVDGHYTIKELEEIIKWVKKYGM